MEDVVWVLVPLMALAIPLTAVAGRVVVKPIVEAIAKLNATQQQQAASPTPSLEQRLIQSEERLAGIERLLDRVLEEQDFQRQLLSGRQPDASPPDRTGR